MYIFFNAILALSSFRKNFCSLLQPQISTTYLSYSVQIRRRLSACRSLSDEKYAEKLHHLNNIISSNLWTKKTHLIMDSYFDVIGVTFWLLSYFFLFGAKCSENIQHKLYDYWLLFEKIIIQLLVLWRC